MDGGNWFAGPHVHRKSGPTDVKVLMSALPASFWHLKRSFRLQWFRQNYCSRCPNFLCRIEFIEQSTLLVSRIIVVFHQWGHHVICLQFRREEIIEDLLSHFLHLNNSDCSSMYLVLPKHHWVRFVIYFLIQTRTELLLITKVLEDDIEQ